MNLDIDNKIRKQLEEWGKQEDSLSGWMEFYKKLLDIQASVKTSVVISQPVPEQDRAKERLANGKPALEFADLAIDWTLLQSILYEMAPLFNSYFPNSGKMPEPLTGSAPSIDLLQKAVKAWFEGEELPEQITGGNSGATITNALIHAALKPFLTKYKDALISFVDQQRWRRGYCPICGGNPDFSYLEKEAGARWLLCSRCDAEWLFQRLECPFCGNLDQKTLAYFTDEKELYRLYTCEKCRHYLKTIDLRKSDREVLLPLERYLTLDLDKQACEQNYSPAVIFRHRDVEDSSPAG